MTDLRHAPELEIHRCGGEMMALTCIVALLGAAIMVVWSAIGKAVM